jgi:precorrin-6A/cobalt-precorrin-6A reductase
VLCRQSGGVTEQLWSDLCAELGLELLLLRQPRASAQVPGLEFSALLAALGHPGGLPQPLG